MRLLFEIDKKDYEDCTRRFVRDSARSIIIRDGKIAMIHSLKYDYFKFPGGGIENGENPVEAMIRETQEEAGLVVKPETVREYGYVHRIQKSDVDTLECFVQDNYYYLCQAEPEAVRQDLDAYEEQEAFTLEFVSPFTAIQKNRSVGDGADPIMCEREASVLELLIAEGFFQPEQPEKPMKIEMIPYREYNAADLLPLYRAVGWTNYTDRPEMLAAAYQNSLCVLGAYDGDKLVGVVRAVGDGASVVFVQDLLVLPEYQRQGIGTQLLKTLLAQYADVYQIELLTDDTPKTTAFYEALGLTRADRLGCCTFLRMA